MLYTCAGGLKQRKGAPVRIAIAGAGVAGCYIYRQLRHYGRHDVDIFDVRHRIACGIHPCGFGVDHNLDPLLRRVGLDPRAYAVHRPPRVLLEGIPAKTTVYMIDKPRLLRDLLDSAPIRYDPIEPGQYDLVVDATGEKRAYAPPLPDDLKARVAQWRVRVDSASPTLFAPTRGIPGYAWVMPLDEAGTEVHVGVGCRVGAQVSSRQLVEHVLSPLAVKQTVCACGARIRLSGPDFARIVDGNVWAVGEAAGLVGPTSGAGIVYALQSGLALVEHLGDPASYVAALRRQFGHLTYEARALRKVLAGKIPNLLELYHVRRGWAKIGIYVAPLDSPRLLGAMRRSFGI
jgi:flavin-dependent dehydrogenase